MPELLPLPRDLVKTALWMRGFKKVHGYLRERGDALIVSNVACAGVAGCEFAEVALATFREKDGPLEILSQITELALEEDDKRLQMARRKSVRACRACGLHTRFKHVEIQGL